MVDNKKPIKKISAERLKKKKELDKAWPPKPKKKLVAKEESDLIVDEILETEDELKLRKLKAETISAELTAQAKALDLLPRKEVDDVLVTIAVNVRNKILSISATISEELSHVSEPVEVQAIIRNAHEDALRELSGLDLKKHFEASKKGSKNARA